MNDCHLSETDVGHSDRISHPGETDGCDGCDGCDGPVIALATDASCDDPAVPDANEQAHSAVVGPILVGLLRGGASVGQGTLVYFVQLVKPVGMPASRMMSMHSRLTEPVRDGHSCSR
jgi:hypothetical protein